MKLFYEIKRLINKALKGIHNFFLLFGISISFVKKENPISALEHNTVENTDKIYTDKEYQTHVLSKSHQQFFKSIIQIFKSYDINLHEARAADVGCGAGNLLLHLNKEWPSAQYYGFDFSEKALDVARKRFPQGIFNRHDIYEPMEGRFNFCFSTEILEHLLYPEKAFRNIYDAVLPGGMLFITIPDGRKDTYSGHINFWSPESWRIFIEKNAPNSKIVIGNIENNLYTMIYKS